MRNAILFLLTLLSGEFLHAQGLELRGSEAASMIPGAEVVWLREQGRAPAYVQLREGSQPEVIYMERWLRQNLKMNDMVGLTLLNTQKDELGFTHHRFIQTVDGLPVEGAMYIVHERNGRIFSVNGEFYPGATAITMPGLTESDALSHALSHVNAQVYQWQNPENEAFIKWEQNNPSATFYPQGHLVVVPQRTSGGVSGFVLAWKFDIYAQTPLSRQWVLVNAQTGAIVNTIERIHEADTPGTANTRYSGTQTITTDSFGGSYRLRETGRGNGINTYDLNNATGYGGAVDFTDANNVWNNVNAQQDEVATDAHWGAEKTYDYFNLVHSRNSIDGSGFALNSYVHYGTNFNNAFWDGTRMTYGDGDGSTFTPLTGLDVTGHEITHGLTEFTANLVYQNESGALNESFSDIFGNTIENYARPSQWNWRIGEDITPAGAIRNMQNPNQYGDPDTYGGTNWYTGAADNGGVHTNSGVQNKWYYILTIGETGTNDLGQAYNVTGQGWVKARAIAFRNLTVYLTTNSDYADARFFSIQAAIDLYGPCTPEVIATTNAWRAVGVGAPFSTTVIASFTASPATSCSAPTTVQFTNTSVTAGTYLWNFGDGGTSTAINPTHTYNALGNYTVTLIGYAGACGNDTTVTPNAVSIQTTNACTYTLLGPTGPNITQTACAGTLYDTGGPTGDYADNTNSTVTISPPGAASITLTFTSFNFEANYDYLYIYNGTSTASPLVGAYTGTTLPNGGTINIAGGSVTIRQFTDVGVVAPGFAMNWNCVMPTTPPVVNFVADETNTCSGTVQFTDQSTNGATAWSWNFGDGFTSTQQHPSHTYQNNGVYTVTLTASNSIGSNQLIRTNYITVTKPAGPSATGASRCGPGTVTLTAVPTGGTLNWYDAASGGNLVGTGASFTTPVLTNSINYYVEQVTPNPVNQTVGPVTNGFGTGGQHNNATPQYEIFDVLSPITIVSVRVYSGGAGTRTINLWNNAGTIVHDTTLTIASGTQTITLNWALNPGSAYRLGGSNMNLYRNNTGAAYPYTLPGKVVITGSSAGSAFFYYFYNWQVKGAPCRSLRTPVPVTINNFPSVSINPTSATICNGTSATLTASGASTYSWSNGGSGTSISVSTPGTYTVTGTDVNGCQGTAAQSATVTLVNPTISLSPSGTVNICPGNSVTISAPAGSNYVWSNGATGVSSITVSAAGTYTVTMTTAAGCTNIVSSATTVVVNSTPTPGVTPAGPQSICAGGSVTLTADPGNGYLWSNGATTQSIVVTSAGSYTVTVTYPGGCTGASAATVVTVNAAPTASITPSGPTTFCAGGNVNLSANAATSWLWSNGATTQSINVTNSGAYSVTITNAAGCTDAEGPVNVTVNALPTASISPSGPTTFCDGNSVTLDAGPASSWSWSNGAITQSITTTASGNFSVTITDANGCTDSEGPVNVTVNALPTAVITPSGPTTFCTGNSVTLTSSTSTGYLWNTSATTQSITVSMGGLYSLTVTDANGCTDAESVTLTMVPGPSVNISASGPTTFCQGGAVVLTANGGNSWSWSTSATSQSVTATTTDVYTVTATDANGCTGLATQSVTVNANPVADFSSSANALVVNFTDLSTGAITNWDWTFGDGGTSATANPSHTYLAPGTYTVTLIVMNDKGCADTVTHTVTVISTGVNAAQWSMPVSVFPNPFSTQLQVNMDLPRAGALCIEMHDLTGRSVGRWHCSELPGGFHSLSLDLPPMASGTYLLKIAFDGAEQVVRVVKQ